MSDIDEVEILDPEPRFAELRWTVDDDLATITLSDGTSAAFPSDMPAHVREVIAALPQDHLELGRIAADAQDATRMALRLQEAAEKALDEAEERLRQFEVVSSDPDRHERVLTTLTYDLEAACNLLIRLSIALGIQPGGELYESIRSLVEKYGMVMKHSVDYEWDEGLGVRTTKTGYMNELEPVLHKELGSGKQ